MNYRQVVARMLSDARCRARQFEVPFDLTENDVLIPDVCPVFGTTLESGIGKKTWNSPTLDRFIPSLGYVRDNVAVISARANTLKSNATLEEIELLAQWMRHGISPRGATCSRIFMRGSRWWVEYRVAGKSFRKSSRSSNREDAEGLLRRLIGGG